MRVCYEAEKLGDLATKFRRCFEANDVSTLTIDEKLLYAVYCIARMDAALYVPKREGVA